MSTINRQVFYANVSKIRPLKQFHVDNLNGLLDYFEAKSRMCASQFASFLAQAYVESAYTFGTIREYGGYNYFRYLIGKLGIKTHRQAWRERGWGTMQTTGGNIKWRAEPIVIAEFGLPPTFDLVDFINDTNRDKALERQFDITVIFQCCEKGLYTGRKLSDYLPCDREPTYSEWARARKVVNGGQYNLWVKQYGKHYQMLEYIIELSQMFYQALKKAGVN